MVEGVGVVVVAAHAERARPGEKVHRLVKEKRGPGRDLVDVLPVALAGHGVLVGLPEDPRTHLKTVFNERYDEVVLLRDIEFHSLCEHHLLPFTGRAHVAYLPDGKVVGLSKLARLVEGFARRPQVQERLTSQIADALMRKLDPRGAIVVIEAEHLCMAMRGIRKPGARTTTSAVRGQFKTDKASRAEALDLILRK